jgi:hypothetical protein
VTLQEIELAIISAQLGIVMVQWRKLAAGIARIIEHMKIPAAPPEKEVA